MDVLEFINH